MDIVPISQESRISFTHKHSKYTINSERKTISPSDLSNTEEYKELLPLTPEAAYEKLQHFPLVSHPNRGESADIHIPIPTYAKLFIDSILHPFTIFQIFSIIVWVAMNYYLYSVFIALFMFIGIFIEAMETKHNYLNIKEIAKGKNKENRVKVWRNKHNEHKNMNPQNEWTEIENNELRTGDLIKIRSPHPPENIDTLLLRGSTMASESMLTGESPPVQKYPPRNLMSTTGNNIIYGGSHLPGNWNHLPVNPHTPPLIGLVIATGFQTLKGGLIRSILHPPTSTPHTFISHSYYFLLFLLSLTLFAFIVYVPYALRYFYYGGKELLLRGLDLLTIGVPPALVAAMSIGTAVALSRLKGLKVHCIQSQKVNVAGVVDLFCFDKTGTLTTDHLQLRKVIPYTSESTLEASYIYDCMGCCHHVGLGNDRSLIGNSMETAMFQASPWLFRGNDFNTLYNPDTGKSLEIIHRFEFKSELQRMSVITKSIHERTGQSEYTLFTKGSPEIIKKICKPSSIPTNYQEMVDSYGVEGLRILALAYKHTEYIDNNIAERESMEENLTFSGLVLFENNIRKESKEVVKELKEAGIKCIMVTGDNPMTALGVAVECGIVNIGGRVLLGEVLRGHLTWTQVDYYDNCNYALKESDDREYNEYTGDTGDIGDIESTGDIESIEEERELLIKEYPLNTYIITGETLRELLISPEIPEQEILPKCKIFTRMTPSDKQRLITYYQHKGHIVGMIGDGANDCKALKQADVGISLSPLAASIAAPFTAHSPPGLYAVLLLLKHGRAALHTSFASFKFMALYSVIQLTSTVILYLYGTNLTDSQCLFIDLVIIIPLSITISQTKPISGPLKFPAPYSTLMNPQFLGSIFGHILIQLIAQVLYIYILYRH